MYHKSEKIGKIHKPDSFLSHLFGKNFENVP